MNFKDYFSFTRGEKRGVLFLLSILIILITAFPLINYFKKIEPQDFSEFEKAIEEFEKQRANSKKVNDSLNNLFSKSFFEFDPNTISDKEWEKLGFKDWQIKAINNYKLKGGTWKIKSDVKKIYGLNAKKYEQLKPFISLPEKFNSQKNNNYKKKVLINDKNTFNKVIDINLADTSDFKKLKGIGSTFAKRIINFRKALGGFISIDQITEVYGFPTETYIQIQNKLTITFQNVNKININSASVDKLKMHPYINWNTANAIVKYRKANGKYEVINDLKKTLLINDSTYLKIKPYLTLE